MRTVVHLDPSLHLALKIKAAETRTSISEYVGRGLRIALDEDAIDLDSFEVRTKEPTRSLRAVLKRLSSRREVRR